MILFYWIIFFIVFFSELYILIGLFLVNDSKLSFQNKSELANIKYQFYILISLFDESDSIENTYDYFYKFTNSNVKCIFITTEKETKISGNCLTKIKLENKKKSSPNNNILLLHYPEIKGNKGSQLNYCLDYYKNILLQPNTFLLIYDCDSRPDLKTIDEISDIVSNNNNVNVIQQNSIYIANNKKSSKLMQLEAFFETRWAFGFERFNQYLSINKIINKYFLPYSYCVGHGMCLRSEYLYNIGKFPEPNEDIPLGMKMMLLQEPIYPCKYKDYANVVSSIISLLRQSGNWIKAPFHAIKILKEVKKIKKISVYRKVIFLIKVIFDLISWFQYLLLLIISFILIKKPFYIIITLLTFYFFNITSILFTAKYYMKNYLNKNFLYILFISPLRHIIRGLAIFSLVYQLLFGWYYDKNKNK